MKPKPLKKYKEPHYPTKLEVIANPALLEINQPQSWLKNAEIAGMISVFLAANTLVEFGRSAGAEATSAAVVAPIFEHGKGYGVMGCVVVGPPVFLSEEEALQVVRQELSKAGLDVSNRNMALNGVKIPQYRIQWKEQTSRIPEGGVTVNGAYEKVVTAENNLKVNVFDSNHKVAVKFVSPEDYLELGGSPSNMSVQLYNLPEIAKGVAEQVKSQGQDVYFGTFYDPAATPKKESKRLLRMQVRDFVDWLKGQGVI